MTLEGWQLSFEALRTGVELVLFDIDRGSELRWKLWKEKIISEKISVARAIGIVGESFSGCRFPPKKPKKAIRIFPINPLRYIPTNPKNNSRTHDLSTYPLSSDKCVDFNIL